jgi:hypothetical protein
MDIEKIRELPKDKIAEAAKNLSSSEVKFLVPLLAENDETVRYRAFLLLQEHSHISPALYSFWDELVAKLSSDNSYQRSIGAILVAENVRWDHEGKFQNAIDAYLKCCSDEKFVTSRQAILALASIIRATDAYNKKIRQALKQLPIEKYKASSQQSLLKRDMTKILALMVKP